MASQIEQLRSVSYFTGLSTADLESISHFFRPKSARQGEFIVVEGDPVHSLYLVTSGVVKVFLISSGGREQVLYLARPSDTFNDVAALNGVSCAASATAMSQVQLLTISKEDLQLIMDRHSEVRKNALIVLTGQVRRLISLISDLSFKRVTSRLARLLLERTLVSDSSVSLTQQQMASMVGTVREMIGRALKDLELAGAIRMLSLIHI